MTTSGNVMCIVVVGLMGWQVTAGGSGAGPTFLFAGRIATDESMADSFNGRYA